MQEIIFQQRNAAKKLTGKTFVLNIAGILVQLSIAQLVINALISWTGIGLLNVAFYLFAVWLLIAFMRETVAAYVYTLKEGTLVLERKLGDSTITVVEIPLEHVASLRPVYMAENLNISYRDVMHIDAASAPVLRVRMAFTASLFSSRLARLLAGKGAQQQIGHVIVYDEGRLRKACTFCPSEELLDLLQARVCERFGFDERMTHTKLHTLYARALERAFPALYGYVDPLLRQEDVQWAREEIERQKAERKEKKSDQQSGKAKKAKNESKEEGNAQEAAPRRRRKQG